MTVPAVQAQANDAGMTAAQLEQLVAPIALYPDTLLTQILMASTYPLEVVEAQRWVSQNAKLKGEALDAAHKAEMEPVLNQVLNSAKAEPVLDQARKRLRQLGQR